jgi:CRISPR/Cas system-associated exonuclease Cas4 (RecB family)
MTIRLSATSIKDYLECPKRFWYRTYKKEQARVSKHVTFGSIVHEALEQFDNTKDAIAWSNDQWAERMSGDFVDLVDLPKPPKSFNKMFKNYYEKILPELPVEEPQHTELFFEERWDAWDGDEDVLIIGKIDKIAGLNVYDWKTGSRSPSKYTLQDFQFYLYDWAYTRMFGRTPNVYYGYLNGGDVIPIEMNDYLRQDVPNIINRVLNDLKAENYHRVTGYQCGNCFYKDFCYGEMEVGVGLEF